MTTRVFFVPSLVPLILASFASFTFGGCDSLRAGKDAALSALSERVPVPVVEQLDNSSWKGLRPTLKLMEDADSEADLVALAEPLTSVGERLGAPVARWNLHIVISPEPNAFALPGGTIAVHSGLFALSPTGEELVGALGHEVGHVVGRHGVEGLVTRAGASIALSLLMGDLGAFTQIALEQTVGLTLLKFSRDQEREADTLGVDLLQKARYPVHGLPTFFRGLQAMEAGRTGDLPAFAKKSLSLLSTHPMSEERAANLDVLSKGTAQGSPDAKEVTLLPAEQRARYARLRSKVLASLTPEEREKHDAVVKAFSVSGVKATTPEGTR
ncbi:MAG: M48 family metallopeptidase [Silvanigrellales bacterium]|nr:M48 family metallopeptidase [Silvanigrellales bacterium]